MKLEFARIETVVDGKVYQQEVCETSIRDWLGAAISSPSLARWSLIPLSNGRFVAVEPVDDVLGRIRELPDEPRHG